MHPCRGFGRRAGPARGRAPRLAAACLALAALPAVLVATAAGEPAPSAMGVDAPELAHLGPHDVGVRLVHLVQRGQPDVLAYDTVNARAPLVDRVLDVDLWYPAADVRPQSPRTVYHGELPAEGPGVTVNFDVPGIAVRNARPKDGRFPLVIVSHGYSNPTAALVWLTENLASKGYVVAAIRHLDPPITDPTGYPQLLLRRPLDIAFVAAQLRERLAGEHLIDPERVALVGYSFGGYGVLTAGGATLDPQGAPNALVPGGLLAPYVRGGAQRAAVRVEGVRAIVALAPLGNARLSAWGADGLKDITAPLFLISGDDDQTVPYRTGTYAIYEAATGATRYLLTFKGAGHAIGFVPAPAGMRRQLWDQDWFEDPVWRKDRIIAINAHFITAFLDLYLRGDTSRSAYLDVPVPDSTSGQWPSGDGAAYTAYSPGTGGITVWKGFQRRHAGGLELLAAKAAGPR